MHLAELLESIGEQFGFRDGLQQIKLEVDGNLIPITGVIRQKGVLVLKAMDSRYELHLKKRKS